LPKFPLPKITADTSGETWQPRTAFLQKDRTGEFEKYPMVDARGLARRKERPKRVKMLVRDFIDGRVLSLLKHRTWILKLGNFLIL